MAKSSALYIGLMSGTSTDGVDGVLADLSTPNQPNILSSASLPLAPRLRETLLNLNDSGPDELVRSANAANALATLYAQTCEQLLTQAALSAADISAIGAHGQTVRHNPGAGYTIQLNSPALLAELTGINVVADFRTRDVAAGGQGAPLVPAFHQAIFSTDYPRTVLNLGGMANITVLSPGKVVSGFDTGPANVLMDLWCGLKTGHAFDNDGQWANTGTPCASLLAHLISSEPWFGLAPPKSTGRDLFNKTWLMTRLEQWQQANAQATISNADIQATLLALTAETVGSAVRSYAPESKELVVCGGGALNSALMQALGETLNCPVFASSKIGVPVQEVEALAFAWLAWAYMNDYAAGQPSVTGARKATVLGCLHKA